MKDLTPCSSDPMFFLVWAALGDEEHAVADLETYLMHAEDSLDIDAMAERLAQLRRKRR